MTIEHTFSGTRGSYKVAMGADGYPTLWCCEVDEHCHSLAGPYQECQQIYIQGCEVPSFLPGPVNILEVGFGLGLGLKATYDFFQQQKIASFTYVAVEWDPALVSWSAQNMNWDYP
ncbi:MAG: hypothetical protein WCG27_07165, partial [Pseudomonadota bacterium]